MFRTLKTRSPWTFMLAGWLAACSPGSEVPDEESYEADPPTQRVPGALEAVTLSVSNGLDRSQLFPLNNQTLSGKVYIYAGPDAGLDRVEFFLDGVSYRIEDDAPFEFEGGAAFDMSTLSTGAHTIKAKATGTDGTTREATATFTVGGLQLLVSTASNLASPAALQGRALTHAVYAFVSPATGVAQVEYFLDDPNLLRAPYDVESASPFVFTPEATSSYDTRWTTNGDHTITARVRRTDGSTALVSAGFTVRNAALATPLAPPAPTSAGKVIIGPNDDAQAITNAHPAGTKFFVQKPASGPRRNFSVIPKDGNQYFGESGLVLDGTVALPTDSASWKTEQVTGTDGVTRTLYVYTFPTAQRPKRIAFAHPGLEGMEEGAEAERYNEELWLSGARVKRRVHFTTTVDAEGNTVKKDGSTFDAKKALRGPGEWALEYDKDTGSVYEGALASKVYMTSDPRGKLLEITRYEKAFSGSASQVVINNFKVDRYGPRAQNAAVESAWGWTVRYLDVSRSHGTGLSVGPGSLAENIHLLENGQKGIGGGGTQKLADGTSRAAMVHVRSANWHHNRTLGFKWGGEGGGSKFAGTAQGLIVENSWVHSNYGPGLWLDIDNCAQKRCELRSNLIENNQEHGGFHEISQGGRWYWNIFRGNGRGYTGPKTGGDGGAALYVSSSRDVEVFENAAYDNNLAIMARNSVSRGLVVDGKETRQVINLWVHHNDIRHEDIPGDHIEWSGLKLNDGTPEQREQIWWHSNNRYDYNTYRAAAGTLGHYTIDGRKTFAVYQSQYGQEPHGRRLELNSGTPTLPTQSAVLGVPVVPFQKAWYGPR